jgi:paraquat-inducible protein B
MRISVVWIIPILAAVVAHGHCDPARPERRPPITVVFKSAGGVEPGKTLIKYKDVTIGQVTEVEPVRGLCQGDRQGEDRQARSGLMVEDAKFWVLSRAFP